MSHAQLFLADLFSDNIITQKCMECDNVWLRRVGVRTIAPFNRAAAARISSIVSRGKSSATAFWLVGWVMTDGP